MAFNHERLSQRALRGLGAPALRDCTAVRVSEGVLVLLSHTVTAHRDSAIHRVVTEARNVVGRSHGTWEPRVLPVPVSGW